MNIFILDNDIEKCAQALCDKHLVKMVLETAQLLCSPFDNGVAPYRRTHYNHPCAKWTRESESNFDWLVNYGFALCREYTYRYGKIHKCEAVINWCKLNKILLNLPNNGLTAFALAMPKTHKNKDAVVAYRSYYQHEKANIARWNKNRMPPSWWFNHN